MTWLGCLPSRTRYARPRRSVEKLYHFGKLSAVKQAIFDEMVVALEVQVKPSYMEFSIQILVANEQASSRVGALALVLCCRRLLFSRQKTNTATVSYLVVVGRGLGRRSK